MKEKKTKKETYDFSLHNKKSHKDVQRYFNKYGIEKTVEKLKQTLGKEKMVSVYFSGLYAFVHYPHLLELRQAFTKSGKTKRTIHIVPLEKKIDNTNKQE